MKRAKKALLTAVAAVSTVATLMSTNSFASDNWVQIGSVYRSSAGCIPVEHMPNNIDGGVVDETAISLQYTLCLRETANDMLTADFYMRSEVDEGADITYDLDLGIALYRADDVNLAHPLATMYSDNTPIPKAGPWEEPGGYDPNEAYWQKTYNLMKGTKGTAYKAVAWHDGKQTRDTTPITVR
ncbi:hypothetical protein ACF064_34855 [Streptomyces sp. NPDC015492]|uniref:hypothetical protein n=1 Tax=Streptomyces sp. NPDC015492 TaxID=3364958 RepID=UPI0036F82799